MAYFHGGDFVELLSAQGKAPAASWKLQGKISKTFDKGIKGNAFTLDGHSGTKMQLPKTTSSSLGLAQRFVILQLLVPFTRSFSVEICYSDFHKIRRRFMVASAFRDITRTALHVQLPLNAVEIPRDQWMNLVFDLHTLSEMHFPGTGYRSMESVCVSGSCRLKRIFTMKDAPTPSQGANVVRHADIRDIPRQFVFSATQRGISDASPIPTLYFPTMPGSGIAGIGGVHGVTVVSTNAVVNGNQKSSRRGGTALATKLLATGTRPVRQTTVLLHHNTLSQPQSVTPDMDADKPSGQRLQTPARVNTTSSKRRQLKSSQGKVVVQRDAELSSPRLHVSTSPHKYTFESTPKIYTLRSKSPIRLNKSQEVKQEEIMDAVPPAPTMSPRSLDRALTPPNSLHSSVMVSPNEKPELRSQTLRQSIMGEIQQKIASLEADDGRADQRDRELFLRHTSLHSGEWHLQKLRDDDFDDDGAILSDDESDLELSSSWRREMPEQYPSLLIKSLKATKYPDDTMANTSVVSRFDAGKEFPFSFSSVEPRTTAQKSTSRLLDFDSLLQDVEPMTAPQTTSRTETEPHLYEQLEKRIDSALTDTEIDADDMDLTKLLAAKRSTKQLAHTQIIDREANVNTEKKLSNPSEATPIIENDSKELKEDSHDLALQCYEDIADIRGERDNWVVVKKNTADPVCDTKHIELSTDACEAIQENVDRQSTRDEDSDIDFSGDMTGLSMDLTSELSANGEGSEHKLDHVDNHESSFGRASPQTDEPKPDRDHTSSKSHHDDLDNDSSFDFEDLVDNAESSSDSDENEECVQTTVQDSTDKTASQQKLTQMSRGLNLKFASSSQMIQVTREKRRGPPVPPRRVQPVKSPLITCHEKAQAKLSRQESHELPIELSSSFSSRRLQSLLESTDWTAELNAQANIFPMKSLSSTTLTSRDRKQDPHGSTADIRSSGSANQSSHLLIHKPRPVRLSS